MAVGPIRLADKSAWEQARYDRTARAASAVVLHYDSDYERIAEVTGQPQEWIVPRGTGHGAQR